MMRASTGLFSLLSLSLLVFSACSGSSAVKGEKAKAAKKPLIKPGSANDKNPTSIVVTYRNKSGDIKVKLDPSNEDLYIDFQGNSGMDTVKVQEKTNSEVVEKVVERKEVIVQHQNMPADSSGWEKAPDIRLPENSVNDSTDINKILTNLRLAQEAVYRKEYSQAAELVKQSLSYGETAEAWALLGSIEYMRQDIPKAMESWNKALEINPDLSDVKRIVDKINSGEISQ